MTLPVLSLVPDRDERPVKLSHHVELSTGRGNGNTTRRNARNTIDRHGSDHERLSPASAAGGPGGPLQPPGEALMIFSSCSNDEDVLDRQEDERHKDHRQADHLCRHLHAHAQRSALDLLDQQEEEVPAIHDREG